eukprot:gnl/Trimastix_PCT/361.p1 GENE.gnl/Trimastix_PCT/361~~gnl/Trimastix_PCT/361.p1  ORF type:complete len:226 (+),score=74.30 gnl/Trimastix_PCT/361:55-678(+)
MQDYPLRTTLLEKLTAADVAGISRQAIEQHFGLYKGYVNNLNALRGQLARARDAEENPMEIADRRRRLGFEYNGVVLHELYFSNMTPTPSAPSDRVRNFFQEKCGSFDKFIAEFKKVAATRSIGWVIVYYDRTMDQLMTHFIELHENGNVAGFQPLLVLDVWEHAYILDYGAAGRGGYVNAFCNNIDWAEVERRIDMAQNGQIVVRQ